MKLKMKKHHLKSLNTNNTSQQLDKQMTPLVAGGKPELTHPFVCTSFVGFTC
ncbi:MULTISPECIES: hypothetical protein [Pseudoalteromonas]|uniref:Uncharacterized protein n=1 Tax=Pseudoalteromonas luteoviolacea (strain 2ta16) TaxID=1353533 RepID=V4JHJ9_PSEL2|nr:MULTISPECIES: hypothetical protein [Pseudoalteromonas]ESP94397.1 hypothetical protein PL2TA16_00397 [Pseudoalteromonas luteoviolacea 2ta16]KZN32091.1 hypothetical protein N483_02825 [Pseudoalteromonas luteoviolacea NCIMB 1944]MCG7547893.1 hypothetical protein [Pseudoalteromonas sp. Of7M-16]